MTQPDKAALADRIENLWSPSSIMSVPLDKAERTLIVAALREAAEFPKTIFTHPSATAEGDKAAAPIISNVRAGGMRAGWQNIDKIIDVLDKAGCCREGMVHAPEDVVANLLRDWLRALAAPSVKTA